MQTVSIHTTPKLEKSIIVTAFDRRRLLGLIEVFRERASDEGRLDDLELELDRADVVEPWEVPGDVVTMNSTVELLDLDTRDALTLTVVFPRTADAPKGRVSVLSPAGLALLGAREGKQIQWRAPGGMRRMKVERVSFQPEASGNFNL